MGYPYIYIFQGLGSPKKCTKIRSNISRVSPRDEVAKNGHNAGRHSQTGIQSAFLNSREVPLRTSGSFLPLLAGASL